MTAHSRHQRALRATLARVNRTAPGLALYRVSRAREQPPPDRTAGRWLQWTTLGLLAVVAAAALLDAAIRSVP